MRNPKDKQNERHAARLLPTMQVRRLLGGVSNMTLWRWLDRKDLGFPRPIVIRRRRYWLESDLLTWIENKQDGEN